MLEREASNTKIDPNRAQNRYFGSAGSTILSAIAIGLGGMGSALNGGRNIALDIINNNIEKDIKKQEFDLQQKQYAASSRKGDLAEMRQRFGDADKARDAYRLSQLSIAEQETRGLMAKYDSPIMQAKFSQMLSDLDAQKTEVGMRIFDRAAQLSSKNQAMRSHMVSQEAVLSAKAGPGELEHLGYVGHSVNKEAGNKAVVAAATNESIQGLLNDLDRDVQKVTTQYLPTDMAKALQTKAMNIKFQIRKQSGGSSHGLSGSALEALDKLFPEDPTQIRTGAFLAQIRALRQSMQIATEAELRGYGFFRKIKEYAPSKE
jgi:hypothetical protein